jgi:hypothetical protein
LFEQLYLPSIKARTLRRFSLFTLTDKAEQDDDCANIYHKSLLYLVSNAFEDQSRIPLVRDGFPILGMEKFTSQDASLVSLLGSNWVRAPNTNPASSLTASGARHHGDFHTDPATLRSTLGRILAGDAAGTSRARASQMRRHRSAASLRERRQVIEATSRG